ADLLAVDIDDHHHVGRNESLRHALRRRQDGVVVEADADVSVVGRDVAARVQTPSDFDDIGAEGVLSSRAHRTTLPCADDKLSSACLACCPSWLSGATSTSLLQTSVAPFRSCLPNAFTTPRFNSAFVWEGLSLSDCSSWALARSGSLL